MSSGARPTRPAARDAAALIEALTFGKVHRHQGEEIIRALAEEDQQQASALGRADSDARRYQDEAREQRERASALEAELRQAHERVRELERQQAAPVVATPEYQQLSEQVEAFRTRIHRPQFWTAAFAETFAESLAVMDRTHRALEVTDPRELPTVFRAWHQELEAAVQLFVSGQFDVERAEQLRRLLICQWVYLRWLELTDHLGPG